MRDLVVIASYGWVRLPWEGELLAPHPPAQRIRLSVLTVRWRPAVIDLAVVFPIGPSCPPLLRLSDFGSVGDLVAGQ